MDKIKRFELVNQLLILEKLYPEETEHYSRHRKALEFGYALHYEWLTESFSDGLSIDECKEVLDILDMYRSITYSWQRLFNDQEIPNDLKFKGFDGNSESALMGYVQYFINDLDRFRELGYGQEFPYFNSHMPMLEHYRRMLREWRKYAFDLTPEQLHTLQGV